MFTDQRHLNIHDAINFENSLSLAATPLKEEGGGGVGWENPLSKATDLLGSENTATKTVRWIFE